MGVKSSTAASWPTNLTMRSISDFDFRRVSWEVTERCNFRCGHCYLDKRVHPGLGFEERLQLLDKLERIGCLWLQLTGGEVLADPLFEETYKAAWERGMLVSISTNGLLLSKWIELFRKYPPRRITVSLYGASEATYRAMTGATTKACRTVIDGLIAARKADLRLRVSIIAAKANAHEIAAMEKLLREKRIEFHTYSKMIPTLKGNREPLGLAADLGRPPVSFRPDTGCAGGRLALYVHASGRASPCKLLPFVSVDLLSEELSSLKRLSWHPGSKPTMPNCASCPASERCTTCAPIFALHKQARTVSGRICRQHTLNN